MAEETPMSITEVAELLSQSERTIRRWMKEKGFPGHKPGKSVFFYLGEVNDWIRRQDASDDSGSGEGNSAEATDEVRA